MSADVLAVRLDSDGDVLLTGPAVRALAAGAAARGGQVDVLASSAGRAAAGLLPGVRDVLTFDAPWSGYDPPPLDRAEVMALVETLAARRYAAAVVFTSFHQSPLPMALLARLAGIPHVAGTSDDYPGSLLDVRHRRPDGLHEVEAALDLARAAGFPSAPGDDRLRVRGPLPDVRHLLPVPTDAAGADDDAPYVVVHPGASVPARAPSPDHARAVVAALVERGHRVVVTGGPRETDLAAHVAAGPVAGRGAARVVDLSGRTDLPGLAAVLAGAQCVVVGNTGPAHLAAAVGTPVVSLFSPVVPADRWAPWGVPTVVLGDRSAACQGSRARECPVPGHPCLTGVDPQEVVDAVARLAPGSTAGPPGEPFRTPQHHPTDASPARGPAPETAEVVA
ncbi:glycosyltransferase family 9 protein [Cellulosimicrobium sp. Marseille-Q4280]|uniref:glycosyltransferase family 9 protein n=1 Tax=Cellulosimicrobium sp. Marseille-Q4280 TaxID=2937992 RepID=UPI00203AB8E2|nr:glycosyltransferase family 9 protein [Cellulosimicrobium sp. Marseille-Q4280]